MLTTTFALDCPADEWVLVADGAEHSKIGLQVGSVNACRIAVAASAEAIPDDAWIILHSEGDRAVSFDLAAGDHVFGQGLSGAAVLRGYRTAVA